ncbi:50S ribosomal protein L18 [Phototrophicus methaneseepsis]|uniref:Large ribosomal subunit protein uL18 n=1 Tax=Phototrophicus methaneseepsis TaxID=2710758 RepID=A0A7S8EDG6_9CHLR|nr:50S ribosomal protein L18 [Phototrophicus methaneseepsis]QPC84814.1 50S ribosomal protein L18 [Phototrophicus methaneseepsis]
MADIQGRQKYQARRRRQRRVRGKVAGTAARPRLCIFRSTKNIFVQVIDDETGRTLVSASTIDSEVAAQVVGKTKTEASRIVGQVVAERAKNAGIETVVFDRGGFKYHGRVAAVADGAREAGLKF